MLRQGPPVDSLQTNTIFFVTHVIDDSWWLDLHTFRTKQNGRNYAGDTFKVSYEMKRCVFWLLEIRVSLFLVI